MHSVSAVVRVVVGLALSLGLAACGASRRREVGEPVTIIVVPAGHPVPVYQGVWPTMRPTPDAGMVELPSLPEGLSLAYVGGTVFQVGVDGGIFADVTEVADAGPCGGTRDWWHLDEGVWRTNGTLVTGGRGSAEAIGHCIEATRPR